MSRLRPQDAETRAQRAIGADFSEALARGLGVIGAFDEQRRQMTLSDVARAVDCRAPRCGGRWRRWWRWATSRPTAGVFRLTPT